MQANKLPVCNIGLFNPSNELWMESIAGVLIKYPILESPHSTTFYLLVSVERGEGVLVIDQDKIHIRAGQVLIIKPNCINQITFKAETSGTLIGFTPDFFSLRYNTNVLHQFSFFNEVNYTVLTLQKNKVESMLFLLGQMLEECRVKNIASQKVLRSYLNILLIELDRMYIPIQTVKVHSAVNDKIQKYQLLIEKHFKTHKMPSEYAEMLHISTNYLNKICRTILGQTSGNLIKKHIILEAKRLLNYTTNSISEIADELGFEHASYFVTIFKKATNQTPEQYRKNQRVA